jgi:DNA processing protein
MESTQTQRELLYEIALSRIEGIGSVLYKQLLLRFGDAKTALQASTHRLKKISGLGSSTLGGFISVADALVEAERILEDCSKREIQLCTVRCPSYPPLLADTYDSPPILYTKGKGQLATHLTLGIVGTRLASAYGKEMVAQICSSLPGIQIISGLAYGIDIAAHRSAIKNSLSTVAVLAHGLDTVYPRSHKKVAEELQETGLIVSEQPPFTPLHPQLFVSRNRIIAGLSEAVIIVESGSKGGSMVTAEYANNYHREVFAVPGDLHRKQSEGPIRLIHENKAQIYMHPQQIAESMRWDKMQTSVPITWESEEEKKVYMVLKIQGETGVDELAWKTQLSLNSLACVLLELEFRDVVYQVPGKKFRLR